MKKPPSILSRQLLKLIECRDMDTIAMQVFRLREMYTPKQLTAALREANWSRKDGERNVR